MKIQQAQLLPHGLYRLHWKISAGGGSSVACIGSLCSGRRWFACGNWTLPDGDGIPGGWKAKHWALVKRAQPITP